jgi:hypothetical protein
MTDLGKVTSVYEDQRITSKVTGAYNACNLSGRLGASGPLGC